MKNKNTSQPATQFAIFLLLTHLAFSPIFAAVTVPPILEKQLPEITRLKDLKEAENNLTKQENADINDSTEKFWHTDAALDHLATMQSFAGDSVGAVKNFDRLSKSRELNSKSQPRDTSDVLIDINAAKIEDAISAITREAKTRQVVILNEAHHVPVHRVFAMLLARELKKIGYEYLACETFDSSTPFPLANGYVVKDTGYYSSETMYASFLNDAVKSGWKFVSYDHWPDPKLSGEKNFKNRETGEAANLVDRVFKQNPKAKIFIYVGYGHASKFPKSVEENDKSMMAAQLIRMTGINPLTIDQTKMYQHFDNQFQFDVYNAVLKNLTIEKPSVLISPQNMYLRFGGKATLSDAYDMQVIHPIYAVDDVTKRPIWMGSLAALTPHDIPYALLPVIGRRLIYAYRLNDPLDAMPVDVVIVEAGKLIPKLMLPEGEFRYSYED
ncbi:hypothetical protein [Solimicrobium silvestre]|uniref:Uncharacterized protein n=1 Tax=Solimicrobium silvestre TaxID=2099400 RepID=A0A2S9H0J5_9BURK|nr:hypothetical protein [Solimicrobium silvestre]PRC93502.1 hypothetical protein S2091_1889 [Solimicrobium silvestre]